MNTLTPSPTDAQTAWQQLGYGLFLHFGPNTLAGTGWGDGKFPASKVHFPKLDPSQWAGLAAEAGMQYAVLTTKHHDGFCLWPTAHTAYCVRNTPSSRDITGEFAAAFRKAGLKVGFYYSLWDRNYSAYENDELYAQYMQDQIRELLTWYGEIVELWFDGAWDKDFPTREWAYDPAWENTPVSGLTFGTRWRWNELYSLIHELQPNCLVANNSSSDRPGQVRYPPVDLRTLQFCLARKALAPEPGSGVPEPAGAGPLSTVGICSNHHTRLVLVREPRIRPPVCRNDRCMAP